MNITCNVCFEDKIGVPCGASNTCKAFMCEDCVWKNADKNVWDKRDCFGKRCEFCKCYDSRYGLKDEIYDIFNRASDYDFPIYNYLILTIMLKGDIDYRTMYYEELQDDRSTYNGREFWCLPCDED